MPPKDFGEVDHEAKQLAEGLEVALDLAKMMMPAMGWEPEDIEKVIKRATRHLWERHGDTQL